MNGRSLTLDVFQDPPNRAQSLRANAIKVAVPPDGATNARKERKRATYLLWRKKNAEKVRENHRKYYASNREAILARGRGYYLRNIDRKKAGSRAYYKAQLPVERARCFAAYGGAVCRSCGFSDWRALSLDHINGGGGADRLKNGGGGGWTFYQRLRKLGYPAGFQILCMNCQFIKRWTNRENSRSGPRNPTSRLAVP